jgi:hypothetical protein
MTTSSSNTLNDEINLADPEVLGGFKKALAENGFPPEFGDGFELEAKLASGSATDGEVEQAYMSYIREELHKLAGEMLDESPYSKEEIFKITESLESFKAAAEAEARHFWEGFESELKKSGADDAFIEGVKKEASEINIAEMLSGENLDKSASAGSFLRMALNPTLWRNPGAQLKGIGAGLASGSKGVQKFVKDLSATPGAAMTNRAGDAVLHSTTPKHIPGSRTKSYADAYEAALGAKMPTPKAQSAIDRGRDAAISQGTSTLRRGGDNAFQQEVHNLSREARQAGNPGQAARDALDRMGKGDFTDVAGRMNVDPTDMNRFKGMTADELRRANIPSEGTLGAAQRYGQDAAASGFNMSGLKTPKFNPEVATGRPIGNQWFRFSPGRAATYGGMGALGGSMLGPAGAALGGLGGAAVGGLGLGGAALGAGALGAGGTYMAGRGLGLWGKDKSTDITGAPTDRNRAIPMLKNNWTGGVGGLVLASLLSQQLGLQGPAAWIVPLLGGVLGYNYFPQMMNRWKDPYGFGANSVSPAAAFQNSQSPLSQ